MSARKQNENELRQISISIIFRSLSSSGFLHNHHHLGVGKIRTSDKRMISTDGY